MSGSAARLLLLSDLGRRKAMIKIVVATFVAFVFTFTLGMLSLGLWHWFHPHVSYLYFLNPSEMVSCRLPKWTPFLAH